MKPHLNCRFEWLPLPLNLIGTVGELEYLSCEVLFLETTSDYFSASNCLIMVIPHLKPAVYLDSVYKKWLCS